MLFENALCMSSPGIWLLLQYLSPWQPCYLHGPEHPQESHALSAICTSPCCRYDKPLDCLTVLREACGEHAGQGYVFNTFLRELALKCKLDSGHSDFWQGVVGKDITLLTDTEAEGTGVTKEEAQRWLQQHLGIPKVATSQCSDTSKTGIGPKLFQAAYQTAAPCALDAACPSQHEVHVQGFLDVQCCHV